MYTELSQIEQAEESLKDKYGFIKRYVLLVVGELMEKETEPTLDKLDDFIFETWQKLQILDDHFGKAETAILVRSAILELWASESLGIHQGLIYIQI